MHRAKVADTNQKAILEMLYLARLLGKQGTS